MSSIREVCKLHDSEELRTVLRKIDEYIACPRKSNEMIGNVESDPEYQLIVEANSIAADIDNEICKTIRNFLMSNSFDKLIFVSIPIVQLSFTNLPRTSSKSVFPNWIH